MISPLSKRQCVFPLFKQFLGTEMTSSQTIIVRECIFKNQNLCFASHLRLKAQQTKFNINLKRRKLWLITVFSLST